jgi:LysR family transcriptional regulator, nitrogen assimilation regulatory protein
MVYYGQLHARRPAAHVPSIVDPKWLLFVKVTELGSLTHAAAALDLPQSVISRHIGALERECGTRLFRRTGRGVVLTDFGEQIFPRVKALIAQADQLSDDISASGGEPLGEVRLGLLPSTVPVFSGPLLRAVTARLPKIRLHLTEGSSVQLEDWLNQGRLDLSLLLREDEVERPGEVTLRRVRLAVIGPPGDPLLSRPTVSFKAVATLPLVLPGEPHLLRSRLNSLAMQHQLTLRIAMEADSIRLQEEIVAAGGGYAIVAEPTVVSGSTRFSTARIVDPELSRRVVLSTTLLRPHTHATRAISVLVQELFNAE